MRLAFLIGESIAATRADLHFMSGEMANTDPLTFGAMMLLLLGVAGATSYLPARRAGKMDPVMALREE